MPLPVRLVPQTSIIEPAPKQSLDDLSTSPRVSPLRGSRTCCRYPAAYAPARHSSARFASWGTSSIRAAFGMTNRNPGCAQTKRGRMRNPANRNAQPARRRSAQDRAPNSGYIAETRVSAGAGDRLEKNPCLGNAETGGELQGETTVVIPSCRAVPRLRQRACQAGHCFRHSDRR